MSYYFLNTAKIRLTTLNRLREIVGIKSAKLEALQMPNKN